MLPDSWRRGRPDSLAGRAGRDRARSRTRRRSTPYDCCRAGSDAAVRRRVGGVLGGAREGRLHVDAFPRHSTGCVRSRHRLLGQVATYSWSVPRFAPSPPQLRVRRARPARYRALPVGTALRRRRRAALRIHRTPLRVVRTRPARDRALSVGTARRCGWRASLCIHLSSFGIVCPPLGTTPRTGRRRSAPAPKPGNPAHSPDPASGRTDPSGTTPRTGRRRSSPALKPGSPAHSRTPLRVVRTRPARRRALAVGAALRR